MFDEACIGFALATVLTPPFPKYTDSFFPQDRREPPAEWRSKCSTVFQAETFFFPRFSRWWIMAVNSLGGA